MDADCLRHLGDGSARIEDEANGLILVLLGEVSACRHAIPSAGNQRQSTTGCLQDRERSRAPARSVGVDRGATTRRNTTHLPSTSTRQVTHPAGPHSSSCRPKLEPATVMSGTAGSDAAAVAAPSTAWWWDFGGAGSMTPCPGCSRTSMS